MAKVWETVKKCFEITGIVLSAILLGSLVAEKKREEKEIDLFETERINQLAAKKREEALMRIERADARKLAESYSGVCDAICDGKERFRNRCKD
ncbi:hypothetical protein [Treponema sp. C6A8]|uniref:hypothetical protein n=1 Tax=Treponema sp. C6A8 TaxID=1410609 RepID=UPI000489719A|nr:hypothetical protein [Treponema sp. C6A8]